MTTSAPVISTRDLKWYGGLELFTADATAVGYIGAFTVNIQSAKTGAIKSFSLVEEKKNCEGTDTLSWMFECGRLTLEIFND